MEQPQASQPPGGWQVRWGTAASGALGGMAAGALWTWWRGAQQECSLFSECFNQSVAALGATVVVLLGVLVLRRSLSLRPVLLPTVLALVGTAYLVSVLPAVLGGQGAPAEQAIAPRWVWVVVGALIAGLSQWVHQPRRRWSERVAAVGVVLSLVILASAWASADVLAGQRQTVSPADQPSTLVPPASRESVIPSCWYA